LAAVDAPRGWVDGLTAALVADGRAKDPDEAATLASAFADRLPGSYFERTTPTTAAADLAELEALAEGGVAGPAVRMAVHPDPDPGPGMFRFRLYAQSGAELSSVLPVLESFGLIVVEAVPCRLDKGGPRSAQVHLDDFGLRPPGKCTFDPLTDGTRLEDAVGAAWRGATAVDSLNRLVVCAGLDWREVLVLRAYRRYRRQAGTAWSDRQLDDPLVEFPAVTRALLAYFSARFDPAAATTPDDVAAARRAVVDASSAVERLEQDQVLRGYLALVDATLRTSHYRRDANGQPLPTLTLKLDSARVPELPPPRPYVETFVYSSRVEGLHLRGGPIARGGIRWSDRQDDLRTEALSLVRAQVLKNAVIVPTGAKGAFVCRRLGSAGVDASTLDVRAEVRECYQAFIRGLLDVTDNVVSGQVVSPDGVMPADGEDPYLVVAADRGTAVFSDLANEISADYRFWLGDAFASGGSHGYDHKAMGITAKGAWVAVQQHFRQLGMDTQAERIRVVGVGDMSGDVFGNGMLRSRTIELVAAFDHRDVFVDPSPDPERSFEERQRLAALPRSSWQDYDRAVLSKGGGVWSRTSKEVRLSPEARDALGITAEVLSPLELISAILAAPADLMWLGGIGTYVKATNESDADAGDLANDRVRIDADMVRSRVVAEGGNLGFTQRARIQYSRRGGKINTDFIDNAAGVVTSDLEVNLKVLLALAIERRRLAPGERDGVLTAVQDDVAAGVLRLVGLSAAALARAVRASAADLDAYEALMAALELRGRLDRKVEALPEAEEMATRRSAGAGLIRPELAVLLAYAKSDLTEAIESSPLARDPAVRRAVEAYFPTAITERFGDLLGDHRLYAQLAATSVSGEIVDRMGITWAHETADEWGTGLAEVAAAYWAARDVTGADRRWRQVDALASSIDAETEGVLHAAVVAAVDGLARTYLRRHGIDLDSVIREDWPVAAEVEARATLGGPGGGGSGGQRGAAGAGGGSGGQRGPAGAGGGSGGQRGPAGAGGVDVAWLFERGVERPVAEGFAQLAGLARIGDVAEASRVLGRSPEEIVDWFAQVDEMLGLPALEGRLAALHPAGRWERWQLRSLTDDVAALRRQAVERAVRLGGGSVDAVADFLDARAARQGRLDRLARQVDGRSGEALAVAALAVRVLADMVHAEGGGPPIT
jgi:glutamate dehydrogenase